MPAVTGSAKRNRSPSDDGNPPIKNNEEEQKREERVEVEEERQKEEDEHERKDGKEVSVTGILEHITHPDFPLEILRKIISFSLETVRYCWMAVPFTNRWNYGDNDMPAQDLTTISWRAQQAIRQAAVENSSPSAIVGFPAKFRDPTDHENGLCLVVPRALQGSEH